MFRLSKFTLDLLSMLLLLESMKNVLLASMDALGLLSFVNERLRAGSGWLW